METLTSICLGVGLAAACGFRVFVPLAVVSAASLTGQLTLAPGFEWIGSYPALGAFVVATFFEVAAYYVPWVDNLLDTVATPAAVVAGTIISASFISDMSPLLRWSLAAVAGGGAAGFIQVTTSLLRGASTLTTGGLANPVFATAELGGAAALSAVALALPVLAVSAVVGLIVFVSIKLAGRLLPSRRASQPSA